ncbi:hypothetical protein IIA15_08070, partial [candidate division TA06 bacterium]|nr:hypothetical protein [candidate division TA06 bacterium]
MAEVNFSSRLRDTVERVSGAVAASVVGMDGIALAGYTEDNTYDIAVADA